MIEKERLPRQSLATRFQLDVVGSGNHADAQVEARGPSRTTGALDEPVSQRIRQRTRRSGCGCKECGRIEVRAGKPGLLEQTKRWELPARTWA